MKPVAKKKTSGRKPARRSTTEPPSEDHASLDENPHVKAAADALHAAREELSKAEAKYKQIRAEATAKIDHINKTTLGELMDGAMEIVRKHPGPSLLAALVAGFMIDRWLRRD